MFKGAVLLPFLGAGLLFLIVLSIKASIMRRLTPRFQLQLP